MAPSSLHSHCLAAGSAKVTPVGPAAAKTGTEGAEQAPEAAEQSPGEADHNFKGVNCPGGEGRDRSSGRQSVGPGWRQLAVMAADST
jgi:hypothetical protein